mgnify:CR=1 FL=1
MNAKPQTPIRTPATVSDLYPSKWLHGDDLPSAGVTVTIAGVDFEYLRNPKTGWALCAIARFTSNGKPTKKSLILNKTQARAIAELAESETFADWRGLKIHLTPETAANGRLTVNIGASE